MAKKISQSNADLEAGWGTILGIIKGENPEWGRVRADQITAIRSLALVRLFLSAFAAIAILVSLNGLDSSREILSWFGLTVAMSGFIAVPQLRQRIFPHRSATLLDLHFETGGLIVSGAMWMALSLIVGTSSNPYQLLVIWAVLTGLMGTVAFGQATIPLGAAMFIGLTGGGLSWLMWQNGLPLVGALAAFYSGVLIAAALASAREYILRSYAERALKEKNEVVSLLLREYEDSGGDWMWQTDTQRCLTHVTPRFAEALHLDPNEIETKPIIQILAGEAWESGSFHQGLHELAERMINRDSFSDLVIPIKIGDDQHWWELSASPRYDENGNFQGFRGVSSDVTDARRSADKINRMARFDTLTGLPNRLQITEALGEAMADAERWRGRCAFMMIDLDRFKAINDTLGHPVGDRLLTQVSNRLKSIMTSNELCGRIGGDEFAVVIKDAKNDAQLVTIAHKIIEDLSQPYEVDHHTLYIGASVGSAIGPRDGRSVETLIRSADLALYRSKDQGGSTYHAYETQLHAHAEERRVLEIALRRALERNELQLHYQPVVNSQSHMIESFEALLRWTNPELGSISPAKFIPIAEEARLIRPIGEWALRTACIEAARWPSTIRVAVNVSAEQLLDANFVTTVVSALSQANLPPHRLELEVTESMFMKDGTTAIAILERILALGVRLALDDFGTGYSSLGYLSKTKFSTIKVDRSFVQGAAKNVPECIAIIRAVVAMADSLGMSTTAEGVENEDECRLITQMGCKKIQGWLFGRPMPAAEAHKLVHESVTRRNAA
ncbi:MAG: EAL domain-containing protein [Sphingomonadales bacterium]|nr:EAL domain-containing protein [Sphingomonadales bacterium]